MNIGARDRAALGRRALGKRRREVGVGDTPMHAVEGVERQAQQGAKSADHGDRQHTNDRRDDSDGGVLEAMPHAGPPRVNPASTSPGRAGASRAAESRSSSHGMNASGSTRTWSGRTATRNGSGLSGSNRIRSFSVVSDAHRAAGSHGFRDARDVRGDIAMVIGKGDRRRDIVSGRLRFLLESRRTRNSRHDDDPRGSRDRQRASRGLLDGDADLTNEAERLLDAKPLGHPDAGIGVAGDDERVSQRGGLLGLAEPAARQRHRPLEVRRIDHEQIHGARKLEVLEPVVQEVDRRAEVQLGDAPGQIAVRADEHAAFRQGAREHQRLVAGPREIGAQPHPVAHHRDAIVRIGSPVTAAEDRGTLAGLDQPATRSSRRAASCQCRQPTGCRR